MAWYVTFLAHKRTEKLFDGYQGLMTMVLAVRMIKRHHTPELLGDRRTDAEIVELSAQ